MMHREVITKRKVPVITVGVLSLTIILYINEYISMVNTLNYSTKRTMFCGLILLSVIVIIRLLSSCNVSYKYSLIGDKLIINKIKSASDKNVESIKLKDIVYIGKKKDLPKAYKGVKLKKYICNKLQGDEVVCVYNVNNEYSKFIFQPSSSLREKINNMNK